MLDTGDTGPTRTLHPVGASSSKCRRWQLSRQHLTGCEAARGRAPAFSLSTASSAPRALSPQRESRPAPPLPASPAQAVREEEAPPLAAGKRRWAQARPSALYPGPSARLARHQNLHASCRLQLQPGRQERHGGDQAREPLSGGTRTRGPAPGKTGRGVGNLALPCPTGFRAQPRASSPIPALHRPCTLRVLATQVPDGYHVGGRGVVDGCRLSVDIWC